MAKKSIHKDLSPCTFLEPVLTTAKKIWILQYKSEYYNTIMVVCLVGIPPDRYSRRWKTDSKKKTKKGIKNWSQKGLLRLTVM